MLIIVLDNHDTLLKEARAQCIGIEVSDYPTRHKARVVSAYGHCQIFGVRLTWTGRFSVK